MRALVVALFGVALAGCSLLPEPEIVRLDGQTASAVEVEGARASCSGDRGDVCLAALGYGATSKDRVGQAQANLQRIAGDNQRERVRLAQIEEMERKKKLRLAAVAKKKKRATQHTQQTQPPQSPFQRQPATTGDNFGRRFQ